MPSKMFSKHDMRIICHSHPQEVYCKTCHTHIYCECLVDHHQYHKLGTIDDKTGQVVQGEIPAAVYNHGLELAIQTYGKFAYF